MAVARTLLAALTDDELGYGDPAGLPRLREELARCSASGFAGTRRSNLVWIHALSGKRGAVPPVTTQRVGRWSGSRQ